LSIFWQLGCEYAIWAASRRHKRPEAAGLKVCLIKNAYKECSGGIIIM
jgi:hypothetical protein